MRLLDVVTLELHEFHGDAIPKYAILSHRWEDEEVSFEDMRAPIQSLSGYKKIKSFCSEAARHGYDYGWADTCCIDKKSSAELSEAINSMYDWYRGAEVCYAYMSDVSTEQDLRESLWFTRGWTLQELIAPQSLIFYDKQWHSIGDKTTFADLISDFTSVPHNALLGFVSTNYSVAQRLSWAAERRTTRIEDQAYCLMGLLDINIPLLYGEGTKAFRRLRDEIMRQNSDLSIFLWHGIGDSTFGMIAASPQAFREREMDTLFQQKCIRRTWKGSGYLCHNGGIEINAVLNTFGFLTTTESEDLRKIYVAYLEPNSGFNDGSTCVNILLIRNGNKYRRVAVETICPYGFGKTPITKEKSPARVLIVREHLHVIPIYMTVLPRLIFTLHCGPHNMSYRLQNISDRADIQIHRGRLHLIQGDRNDCVAHPLHMRAHLPSQQSRTCDCTTYIVESKPGKESGFFCYITVTATVPHPKRYKLQDFVRSTICFGFNRDFGLIYLILPYSTPFAGGEMDPFQTTSKISHEDLRSTLNCIWKHKFAYENPNLNESSGVQAGYISEQSERQTPVGGGAKVVYISKQSEKQASLGSGWQGPWRLPPFSVQRSIDYQVDLTFDVRKFLADLPADLTSDWEISSAKRWRKPTYTSVEEMENKLIEVRQTKLVWQKRLVEMYSTYYLHEYISAHRALCNGIASQAVYI